MSQSCSPCCISAQKQNSVIFNHSISVELVLQRQERPLSLSGCRSSAQIVFLEFGGSPRSTAAPPLVLECPASLLGGNGAGGVTRAPSTHPCLSCQAIGARNQLKSIAKQREAQEQQLQALIAEKKMQLER